MTEIWKDIKGYEGLYQISNFGNVKRIKGINSRYYDGYVLNTSDNGQGYKLVGLSKNKKRTNHYIHRLVAEAFIDNPQQYKEINHIDNNKSNNKVQNLEWCDRSYNVKYSYKQGRLPQKNMIGRIGEKHPMSKPVMQYDTDGNFIREYGSARLASTITGVDYSTIKHCRRGKVKTAGGYIWKNK